MGINYVNYKREMRCKRCGLMFIANAPNTKFCDACKPIAAVERLRKERARRRALEEKKRAERAMKKYKGTLDQKLEECKAAGLTYAEAQRAKTLSMIPKIEV